MLRSKGFGKQMPILISYLNVSNYPTEKKLRVNKSGG